MGRWPRPCSALVVAGAIALLRDLDGVWILVAALPLVVFACLRMLGGPAVVRAVTLVLGLVVVPVFATARGRLGLGAPHRLASGRAAQPGCSAACSWEWPPGYTCTRGGCAGSAPAGGLGRSWRSALVVVPPAVLWAVGALSGDESSLEQRRAVVSQLDVIVLSEGGTPADSAPPPGWRVSTWRGQIGEGERIRWGPEGPPPIVPREDADRVLLLMVDGGPERLAQARALPDAGAESGELERWLSLADRVASTFTPTFALLRSSDAERLASWRGALAGRAPGTRRGGAVSLDSVEGSRTTTDLALRLAVLSPTSDSDLALAAKHRPALFFDSEEPYPTPLNVDRLVASGRLRLCEQGQAVGAVCSAVDEPRGPPQRRDPPPVRPRGAGRGERREHDLRAREPRGQRPSELDLPRLLVVLPAQPDRRGRRLALRGRVRDRGRYLLRPPIRLGGRDRRAGRRLTVRRAGGRLVRAARRGDSLHLACARAALGRRRPRELRPRHGHARTAARVRGPRHARVLPDQLRGRALPGRRPPRQPDQHPTREKRHDGGERWPRDERADCPSVCVAALPLRGRGQELGLWNAFDGGWGTSDCVLEFVCTSSAPPRSPGFQGRYRHPWCASEVVAWRPDGFSRSHPRCAGEGTVGERDHGKRATARARRLVLLGAGRGRLRPRHQRRREHLLPLAPGLAAATGEAARPGGPAVARVQRRRRPRRAERAAGRRGGAPVGADRADRGRPRSRDDHDRRERRGLRGGAEGLPARELRDEVPCVPRATCSRRASLPSASGSPPSTARSVRPHRVRAWSWRATRGCSRSRERWAAAGGCLMRTRISGDEVDYLNALNPGTQRRDRRRGEGCRRGLRRRHRGLRRR